jgi:chemotaxis-related protein WspB
MTLVAFSLGSQRYGIGIELVTAVLPVPPLRPLAGVPAWVAGLMRFGGRLVPVIDLAMAHGEPPVSRAFGTRVMIVDYPLGDGQSRWLGLMAERVSDIVQIDASTLQAPGVIGSLPWLGRLGPEGDGTLVQLVEVANLMPEAVRALLLRTEG